MRCQCISTRAVLRTRPCTEGVHGSEQVSGDNSSTKKQMKKTEEKTKAHKG